MSSWSFPESICSRLIDGDTLVARSRIMEDEWRDFVVRLLEVDTPEIRGPERSDGLAAMRYVQALLFDEQNYPRPIRLVLSGKKDMYGRWLGWVKIGAPDEEDLAFLIADAGFGESRELTAHVAKLTGEEDE